MIKFLLPNNETLELSPQVINLLKSQIQQPNTPEKGGLLLGRTTLNKNTKLMEITTPFPKDIATLYHFSRKDKKHLEYLEDAKERLIYFKGNWHTHPENYPTPSIKDLISWNIASKTSTISRTKFLIFIIIGRKVGRIWVSNSILHNLIYIGEF